MIAPAMARPNLPKLGDGMQGSYAGVGAAIGTDDAETTVAIMGRVDTAELGSGIPVSLRPAITIGNEVGGSLGATYDIGLAKKANIYVGAGAGFGAGTALNTNNEVAAFVQVGAEGEVRENIVLFADFKVGFGSDTSYIPTVGIGYKF